MASSIVACRVRLVTPSAAPYRIEAERVRQGNTDRNAAVEQPQVGRDLADPVGRHLRGDLLDVHPDARGGHRIHVPGDLRIPALHTTTSTTPSTVPIMRTRVAWSDSRRGRFGSQWTMWQ
jgi:hypothetical protein